MWQCKRFQTITVLQKVQRAMTVLLTEGHLERHIQRMRHHYAEKRALLSSVLAPLAPKAQLLGLEAGLHAYLELSPDLNTKAVVEQAYKQGLVVTSLDEYYLVYSHERE